MMCGWVGGILKTWEAKTLTFFTKWRKKVISDNYRRQVDREEKKGVKRNLSVKSPHKPSHSDINTSPHTPLRPCIHTLFSFQSVYNQRCLSCSAGCFTTCIWMPTGVHPSLSDSTIKDDAHNEGSFHPSGAAWGQGSTSKTATALQLSGHNEGAKPRPNIERLFTKAEKQSETNYTQCWIEKFFSCSFSTAKCVLTRRVCLTWPKEGDEKKKGGGGTWILMKP